MSCIDQFESILTNSNVSFLKKKKSELFCLFKFQDEIKRRNGSSECLFASKFDYFICYLFSNYFTLEACSYINRQNY